MPKSIVSLPNCVLFCIFYLDILIPLPMLYNLRLKLQKFTGFLWRIKFVISYHFAHYIRFHVFQLIFFCFRLLAIIETAPLILCLENSSNIAILIRKIQFFINRTSLIIVPSLTFKWIFISSCSFLYIEH